MPNKRPPPVPSPVSIEVNGRRYNGKYVVEGRMITVSALAMTETTQVGGTPVEDLARTLLSEIVRKRTPTPA